MNQEIEKIQDKKSLYHQKQIVNVIILIISLLIIFLNFNLLASFGFAGNSENFGLVAIAVLMLFVSFFRILILWSKK